MGLSHPLSCRCGSRTSVFVGISRIIKTCIVAGWTVLSTQSRYRFIYHGCLCLFLVDCSVLTCSLSGFHSTRMWLSAVRDCVNAEGKAMLSNQSVSLFMFLLAHVCVLVHVWLCDVCQWVTGGISLKQSRSLCLWPSGALRADPAKIRHQRGNWTQDRFSLSYSWSTAVWSR